MSTTWADPSPGASQVRKVLERVIRSTAFSSSPKLCAFLFYIVEEELAGRGRAIKGKSIATDVYLRQLDEAGSAQNLVRVEARRLRRVLEEYYAEEGQSDPVRIRLASGSYRPRFDTVSGSDVSPEMPEASPEPKNAGRQTATVWRFSTIALGALSLVLIAVISTAVLRNARPVPREAPTSTDVAERSALRARSITSVQAVNLAEQSRGFFFPLFDLKRQDITLDAFRHVITLDPELPDGYAGAAQVLALQAFVTEDSATAEGLNTEAQQMARRATDLGPTDGWAHAALGWTLATSGETERALRHARIALDLSADDGHVQDLVALTALVANEPSLMAEASNPERVRNGEGRFGANSLWGTSQLMLGNYAQTIEAFSSAAERGLPVSAPSLFLLATAYHEMGDSDRARTAIAEMATTWPGFPANAVATRFFANDPVTLKSVEATLAAYLP